MFRPKDIKIMLDFCVFAKFFVPNFKICDIITDITTDEKIHFQLFLQNLRWYQNETRSDISTSSDKHFELIFSSIVITGI